MAIRASWALDREEGTAGYAPRFRKLSEAISKCNADDRRRRSIARPSSRLGTRTDDRQLRFIYRFYFAGAIARSLFWIAHFPAPERDWPRWKSRGNSKFHA